MIDEALAAALHDSHRRTAWRQPSANHSSVAARPVG